jgi:hypothetical protein
LSIISKKFEEILLNHVGLILREEKEILPCVFLLSVILPFNQKLDLLFIDIDSVPTDTFHNEFGNLFGRFLYG